MAATRDAEIEDRPAGSRRLSPRVRRMLFVVAGIGLVVLAALLIRYRTHGRYFESTNDAYVRADTVTVSPKVSGYVDQLFVTDNQEVRAGQPLLRIDARDYRAQSDQYQAQVAVAAANAENVRAGIGEQQAAVAQARARLAASQASARFAQSEVARYRPLAASGAEPREKLAQLANQATQAAAQATADAAALETAQRRIGSLEAQVRQARAQGQAARAQLAAAEVNVGSTVLRAAVNGRIGDKSVRAGQFVQAGTRLMSVVPVASSYVVANFKETQIGRMRAGQTVAIEVDALPGVALRGHIESLSPATGAQFSLLPPQNATGNFTKIVQRVPVRIAIDAAPDLRAVLVPGLSVEVSVDTRTGPAGPAR